MSRERGRIGFFVTDLALGHVLKKYNKKNPNSGMPAFDKGIKEIFSSLIKPFSPINENISSYMILESGSHDISRTARENSLVGQDLHKEDKIVGEIPPSLESIPGQIAFEDSKVRNSESFQISLDSNEKLADIINELQKNNKRVWASWTSGKIILTVVGAAALTTGVGILLYERNKKKQK
ncbi:MAG: hypothetical protein CO135_00950 [Candidatus Levybacteria bacterium CG_4_9_14_3_um_filter_35_16]|nr:MAG: hypothetical protein COY68_03285 [Candidatus Levybacteria bacterium CG_4_10_14_0_8_um_filter_35_23]PIZ97342.1 MAG: hypothetical protein COX78_04655 [Candidatus Levybacteria bacterium CG_4_10_14_0_2_um_filter_35_8]PJA91522.1 MAG: hypothetical protein CO135_00950 [Candidatus Levybacteria bacterium CG_4_9_14_3_um_filter_35_16]PJC54090.1 MAG: hypothetical protein CO028_04315 [Candidatus Levybacteria bacterium CG_4_9_14_0_2_um_filter_35_21]